MSNNTNNVTVTINTHPFCNLTTNTPLEPGMSTQYTFYYYLRTTWLVCRIFLLTIFAILAILILIEIILYIRYQRAKKKTWKELLHIYHFQLLKLILLFIASVARVTWFIQPYFVEIDKSSHIFSKNMKDHHVFSASLLRLGQLLILIVLFLQIKSWRQTVRHTRKLKSKKKKSRGSTRGSSIVSAKDVFAVKLDTFVVWLTIILLVIAAILNVLIPEIDFFLYTSIAILIPLIPSATYYVYGLHKLIVAIGGNNSRVNTKKHNAINKIKRIRRSMVALLVCSISLFTGAGFRASIDLCDKDNYVGESVRYLIFVLLVHLVSEFNATAALFYTLHSKKEHGVKAVPKSNNYESSSYDESATTQNSTKFRTESNKNIIAIKSNPNKRKSSIEQVNPMMEHGVKLEEEGF